MLEGAAIPHAQQRRHFVETGAAARLRGERWIGADGLRHYVRSCGMAVGGFEAARGRELVVCIEWRLVAAGAILAVEHLAASLHQRLSAR